MLKQTARWNDVCKILSCLILAFALPFGALAQTSSLSEPEQLASEESSENVSVKTLWLTQIAPLLTSKSFSDKELAVQFIAASDHPEKGKILTGLLAKQVIYNKEDKSVWFIENLPLGKGSEVINLSSGVSTVVEKKRQYRTVTLNNNMRTQIKTSLATASLTSDDLEEKRAGAKRMMGQVDSELASVISDLMNTESDAVTKKYLHTALSITQLDGQASTAEVLIAIEQLQASGLAEAFEALKSTKAQTTGETPDEIQQALDRAISSFEETQRVVNIAQTLYFGLSLGSVLVLAGIGLAITFGVMGVINMAHGELIMIGAYTTYVMQLLLPDFSGVALILSIPAAFIVSGLVGVVIERSVIRHLYGRPLETLLATFGISLILQQAVRSIFSPLNRSVSTPEFMSGMIEITPMLQLTASRMYIIIFCLMVFFALLFILKRTSLGLQVRAVSQNRPMARAMGVRSEWVDMATFGLGSGVAGVAGVALSQLTNVGPNMGQAYIIDSFMVVVFGGVGNLWGTLAAGLSLGVFNKILEPWAGAVLAKILVLVFIILFIQKRPKGLFPQRGRMAED
ncbi:urea ABC transporter permease subunit UrtB [Enterovibrio norvegicus FF-454]|uniref:Urea ABC transporter permease subunit UrtB n=2 Tax=Enterovibrio norvegicus TaxID=188144 RepID=A0A1E5CBP2_9GAMM|nr:urea ABC transporter permease subunit UrtB [Enterovibrio norvegicus]OEE62909.1 urea ABC transporter permease subunit UrtB [Enterovibrio norvegicus FF-454]